MKVLVTGAFGYFGVALCRRLLADGHDVVALGRPPRASIAEPVRAALSDARQIECDALGVSAFDIRKDGVLRGIEALVHLAGGGASGGASAKPMKDLLDNVLSATYVASAANPGTRLLLASSIYVYGAAGPRLFAESDTRAPDTLYGQMKCVAESVWRQYGGTSLRFAHIYGAGSGIDFGRDGVTERLARAAAGGEPFQMHGDGSQLVDLVHIDDACEAVALALAAPEVPPAVNIGGGDPWSIEGLSFLFGGLDRVLAEEADARSRGFCSTAWAAMKTESARLRRQSQEGLLARAMDISLAASALGWSPRVSLAAGARGLVEMIRGVR